MVRGKPRGDELAVRIVLRWLPTRKVWTIVATYGTHVVTTEAETQVPVDRTDLVRLAGAVRDELERWIPYGYIDPEEAPEVTPHVCEAVGCQGDTPWAEAQ